MFGQYQMRADSLPGRMVRNDDIPSDYPWNPGDSYQVSANRFPGRMMHADDPRVPYTPIQDMARRAQARANGFPQRIINADDLQLGSAMRRSGSMMHSLRTSGLGDAPVDTGETTSVAAEPMWKNPMVWLGAAVVAGGGYLAWRAWGR